MVENETSCGTLRATILDSIVCARDHCILERRLAARYLHRRQHKFAGKHQSKTKEGLCSAPSTPAVRGILGIVMLSTIDDLIAGTDGNYNLALRVLQLSNFSRRAILDLPMENICDAC